MNDADRPARNPHVVLREEFDDWAILFNPDTGRGFGLSPTGVCVWKLLDGEHTIDALLEEICQLAKGVPEEAGDHIQGFVGALVAEGLAGFDLSKFGLGVDLRNTAGSVTPHPEKCSDAPRGAMGEVKQFTYESPQLVNLTSMKAAHGDCSTGSVATGYNNCWPGGTAGEGCISNGSSATSGKCNCTGTSPASYANCYVGNCPLRYSQTCSDGGTLCQSGGTAPECSTCSFGAGG